MYLREYQQFVFPRHCLQYLVDCDEVIFMKEGCITERGTHEELMNLNGDYATIFNNLLLGETPPVEVRLTAFICLISTQAGMMAWKPEEPSLTLFAYGFPQPHFCAVFTCSFSCGRAG